MSEDQNEPPQAAKDATSDPIPPGIRKWVCVVADASVHDGPVGDEAREALVRLLELVSWGLRRCKTARHQRSTPAPLQGA